MRTVLVAGALSAALALVAPAQWTAQTSPTRERLRGVSAVSEKVAWASGARGTVLRTTDGGTSWLGVAPPESASLDFRDIEAVDANRAYVLAIGAGDKSRIYRTLDGGATWTLVFSNADPKAFYDAIAFWDPTHGLAFGDPVEGRFTVLRTDDGTHWSPLMERSAMPEALPNEGAFAASGTCLVTAGKSNAWFVTGGAARTRVFRSTDRGATWQVADTPLGAGVASAGGFSLAFADGRRGLLVGGDYRKEGEPSDFATTDDGGRTWVAGRARLRGFRSAAGFWRRGSDLGWIVTGPAGSDWSMNRGETWTAVPGDGFDAISIAPGGAAAWASGARGRVALLRPLPISEQP